jgi:hypothetical protein
MKKIVSICGITTNAFAQGGPNGPPNPACNGPNPPPWCDGPTVPIDNWQLILLLILTGIVLGVVQIHRMKQTSAKQ